MIDLQQLKGMQSSKQGMWKGYHLSIEGIQKGYLFHEKWYIKGKGLDLGAEPPHPNICWVLPSPPGHWFSFVNVFSCHCLFSEFYCRAYFFLLPYTCPQIDMHQRDIWKQGSSWILGLYCIGLLRLRLVLYCILYFIGSWILGLACIETQKKKDNFCYLLLCAIQHPITKCHVVVKKVTANKCTKLSNSYAVELLFWL